MDNITTEPRVRVVFRKYPDGSIIALFPQIPASVIDDSCLSYQHVGQHGGANYDHVISRTSPAFKAIEYGELYSELEKVGYRMDVIRRAAYADHTQRRQSGRNSMAQQLLK